MFRRQQQKKTTYNTQRNSSITFMKNVSLILITLGFVLVALIGCQRNYTLYERHDITACGVKDPLVNLPWLAKLCKNSFNERDMSIFLLQDTITQDYFFETNRVFELYGRGKFSRGEYYNCEGDTVMIYNTVTPPESETLEFKKNKKIISTIWSIKQ